MIDIDYYLSQQSHPVGSRLCASIQGTSPARLADCLGLDSSKFQHKTEAVLNDPSSSLLGLADDEERYRGCEPLLLSCPSCSSTFECPSVSSVIFSMSHENLADIPLEKESSNSFWHRMCCPRCSEEGGGRTSPVMIANQVKRQAEKFISLYYTSSMMYTEVDLYKQLSYFCHVLDTVRCMKKQEYSARVPYEKDLLRIRPVVDSATLTIQQIRDHCAYGWIQLNDLTVSV